MPPPIHARELFDGHRWHDGVRFTMFGGRIGQLESAGRPAPGDEAVACVMPGFVDCGAVATGYTERPTDDPFRPERAFAKLCLRYGVTTVFDLGSSLPVAAYLARSGSPSPRMMHSGGRLVSVARTRNDIVVDASTAQTVLDALAAARCPVLAVGAIDDGPTQTTIVRHARRRGLSIAWSAHTPTVDLPGWLWTVHPTAVPSPAARAFTAPVDDEVLVAPELEACARYTVDGLTDASEAWIAAPVLPYARHFAQSKGRLGRRVTRQVLEPMYGERDGDDLGSFRPIEVARAAGDGRCLTASGAGRAGLVPGLSLWAEAQRIHDLGTDEHEALHAATGAVGALGIRGIGTIREGGPADLLVLRSPPVVDGRLDHHALSDVFVRGTRHRIADIAHEVDELTRQTFAETS